MKTRNGFVSNSSSSSFVVGFASDISQQRRAGNPLVAWEWLKFISRLSSRDGLGIWKNGEQVDFQYCGYRVYEYDGCCEMCYGPLTDWSKQEFLREFCYDQFQFSQEQADKFNKTAVPPKIHETEK